MDSKTLQRQINKLLPKEFDTVTLWTKSRGFRTISKKDDLFEELYRWYPQEVGNFEMDVKIRTNFSENRMPVGYFLNIQFLSKEALTGRIRTERATVEWRV